MDYDRKFIGQALRKLRKERKKSQEVISSFAGVARSHLSMIENGNKNANFETLWKLADAFEIKPSELVSRIEDEALLERYRN